MNTLLNPFAKLNWRTAAQIGLAMIVAAFIAFAPSPILAQNIPGTQIQCPQGSVNCQVSDVRSLIQTVIRYALAITFLAAFLYLIYGGFQYVTAGGNDTQAKAAKNTIFNAIIGLVVVGLAFVIIQVVFSFVLQAGTGASPF